MNHCNNTHLQFKVILNNVRGEYYIVISHVICYVHYKCYDLSFYSKSNNFRGDL